MPSWKKVITSGSNASLNSLNITTSLTASGLIYPTIDGTSGQVIQTDGAGNLSFSNIEYTAISIKNVSGGTIAKGTPCYITGSGTSGNIAGVWPADASNPLRMPAGVIAGETLNNGDEGLGLINGFINGVNTSAFAAGDSVYVAAGGGYTNIRPTGSAILVQKLGNVEKSALNGSGVINGPGYYNDLPNIQQGYTWVGNADGVAIAIATSSIQNVISASYAATSSYATQFNVATGLTASGLIYPIADNGNESYIQTDGAGNLSLQYVKSMYETVRNRETSSIISGIPLFVSGATGANSDVYIADASNPARMPATYIASETIAPSGTGKALISGLLTNINTTAYQAGQELFVNTGSGLTTSRPPYPNSVQLLGIVTRVGISGLAVILNPGQIEIQNIQPGYTLVGNSIGTPTAVATSSLSVASASFATSASYAPSTPTFPYTGSAEITGSLGVTGSFNLQTFNGLTDVTALDFSGVTRAINDIMGSTSINADDRDLYDSSTILSVAWEGRRLVDTVSSQSVNWNDRLLKIDNGPGAFTVNWGGGLLRDTGSNNSVDWQNRIAIDTGTKTSVDWQNRQLKNSSGNEVLNWSSGVAITGSLTVSGSLTVTGSLLITGSSTLINQGPTILSGSFKVQGEGDGFGGPITTAITVDDINFTRKLHDSQTGSGSLDFANRDLLDANGAGVFNWSGFASTIDSRLYINQNVSSTSRDALITNIGTGGHLLNDVTFDATVSVNDLCYLDTTNVWKQVDQTTNSASRLLGICMGYNPMTYIGQVLLEGDVVVTTGTGYPIVQGADYGLTVFIAQGAGTIMDTAEPTSGIIRRLGYCYHNNGGTEWIMKFRPSNDWA